MGKNAAAEWFSAIEVPAGLRPGFVDRAELRRRIEGRACTVAALIHAAQAIVLDDQLLRHDVTRPQLDNQMAAAAAAGTQGEIKVGCDSGGAERFASRLAIFCWARL